MTALTKARSAKIAETITEQTEVLKRTRDFKKTLACWACYCAAVDLIAETTPDKHPELWDALALMRKTAHARGAAISQEMTDGGKWGVR